MESHKYSQCNNFNEQTKQKEEEIAKTYFNENLEDFFKLKKSYESTFHFIIQIKVPVIALDSSKTICKREFSARVSVAL